MAADCCTLQLRLFDEYGKRMNSGNFLAMDNCDKNWRIERI